MMTEEETTTTNEETTTTTEETTPTEPLVIGNIQYDFNQAYYKLTFKGKATIKNPQNPEKQYIIDTTNDRIYKKIGDKKITILPTVPPAITGTFTSGTYTIESLIGQTTCTDLACDKEELDKKYVYLEQYLTQPAIYKEDIQEFLNWLIYFNLHPIFTTEQAEYITYKTSETSDNDSESETEPETVTVEIVPECLGTQTITFTPNTADTADLTIGTGTGIIENGTTNYFLLTTDETDDTKLNMYYITPDTTTAIYEPLTAGTNDTITYEVEVTSDQETGDAIVDCELSGTPTIVSESIETKLTHTLINTINRIVEEEGIEYSGTLFQRLPNPALTSTEEEPEVEGEGE